jgi:beta-lactamase superfamily II metal-dependent hydrolase
MKLRVYHAADGDCLLLSTEDRQHHALIDGGRKGAYLENTRPDLARLREAGQMLDIVCVSHIDNDHISGVLALVEDEVAWRKFAFQQTIMASARPPPISRPPRIGQIWHNAHFQLVGPDLALEMENALAISAGLLAGSDDPEILDLASAYDNLATGEKSAMELSRRISAEQLAIPLNPSAGGELMVRGTPGETLSLGGIRFYVLGPSVDDLVALRETWQEWLDRNKRAVTALQSRMLADEQRLGTLSPALVANPVVGALGEGLSSITRPNLASLTLLAEEDQTSILLTGDADSEELLRGLAHHHKLDAQGDIHVTVLKVQHHGALANVTQEFVEHVTADHYVFCGNGADHNPEGRVVQALARARMRKRNTPFKFWFTSSGATPGLSVLRRGHMRALEAEVEALIAESGGLMAAVFMAGGYLDVL